MKFLTTQVTYFLSQKQTQQNIRALLKYLLFLALTIILFSVLFHIIMIFGEGKQYSWITGFYWTLTVMSTLGFGDITFETDIGRAFSMVVLLSGIVLLLVMLPFAFIRFFYAPWLEAQIHTQAPRGIPENTEGHVIICNYDSIAPNLIKRLDHNQIPYFVIEEDSATAAQLHQEGVSVVYGPVDSRTTYARLLANKARLIFANREDTINTNITLTAREVAPNVPIAAVATNQDSIDIFELSGIDHVFPLKHELGEQLANRINIGGEKVHQIGAFDNWEVFEFMVKGTSIVGKKIHETEIRESTGVNIVGIWKDGTLIPSDPEMTLTEFCVPVAVGTGTQISKLKSMLSLNGNGANAVLVLGAGKVGRAAARALKRQNRTVFMVDTRESTRDKIGNAVDRFVVGDAADRETVERAGLQESSLAILSTNNDAVNIYLSIYCRRLNPNIRIVCRVTHERNLEAVHRAGADFVLSYAPLGAESIISLLQGREPVIMGEGVEFFTVKLPKSLAGKTLKNSGIGSKTGMIVLAVRKKDEIVPNPSPDFVLPKKCRLNILGTTDQLQKFKETFE